MANTVALNAGLNQGMNALGSLAQYLSHRQDRRENARQFDEQHALTVQQDLDTKLEPEIRQLWGQINEFKIKSGQSDEEFFNSVAGNPQHPAYGAYNRVTNLSSQTTAGQAMLNARGSGVNAVIGYEFNPETGKHNVILNRNDGTPGVATVDPRNNDSKPEEYTSQELAAEMQQAFIQSGFATSPGQFGTASIVNNQPTSTVGGGASASAGAGLNAGQPQVDTDRTAQLVDQENERQRMLNEAKQVDTPKTQTIDEQFPIKEPEKVMNPFATIPDMWDAATKDMEPWGISVKEGSALDKTIKFFTDDPEPYSPTLQDERVAEAQAQVEDSWYDKGRNLTVQQGLDLGRQARDNLRDVKANPLEGPGVTEHYQRLDREAREAGPQPPQAHHMQQPPSQSQQVPHTADTHKQPDLSAKPDTTEKKPDTLTVNSSNGGTTEYSRKTVEHPQLGAQVIVKAADDPRKQMELTFNYLRAQGVQVDANTLATVHNMVQYGGFTPAQQAQYVQSMAQAEASKASAIARMREAEGKKDYLKDKDVIDIGYEGIDAYFDSLEKIKGYDPRFFPDKAKVRAAFDSAYQQKMMQAYNQNPEIYEGVMTATESPSGEGITFNWNKSSPAYYHNAATIVNQALVQVLEEISAQQGFGTEDYAVK